MIRDRDTGDLSAHRPGDIVDLTDPRGQWLATAVVDPANLICARVLSRVEGENHDDAALAERLDRALLGRKALVDDQGTSAFRLVHGAGDGLPGLFVDSWGPVLVATRSTPAIERLAQPVYEALQQRFPDRGLFEQDHFTDLRSAGTPTDAGLPGRWLRKAPGGDAVDVWAVREAGLLFQVSPLSTLTTGLYPDQRRNRHRLMTLIGEREGQRIANTFSHTGAFSVACAAAGAKQVVSLDIASRYCAWAEDNLRANGHDPGRHPVLQADALEWLDRPGEDFDGFVLDPPAHARARKRRSRGWNLKRDFRALVTAAAKRASTGAWMLCCVNLKTRSRAFLKDQLQAGLRDAGRTARRQDGAPSGLDYPQLRGFPEGRPFEGLLVHLD